MELRIVSGETGVTDGSFLSSNVSWESRYDTVETVKRSTIKNMDELENEFSSIPGYIIPESVITEKKGLGYLTEMTVDTKRQNRLFRFVLPLLYYLSRCKTD